MATNKGINVKTGLVIMSGSKVVYQAGSTEGLSMSQAPVGKGKGAKTQTKTRASAKGTPEIIYPMFLSCALMCTDKFWKTHFEQAAIGVFHRGFSYNNGILIHRMRSKSKTSHCEISTDPGIAMQQFKSFLQEKAGIMSDEDSDYRQNELERNMEATAATNLNSWNAIKTTTHRTIVIGNFVDQLGLQFNMSLHERHNLINLIRLGIVAGYFDATTINVDRGAIVSIAGLIKDENDKFNIDIVNLEPKSKKAVKTVRPKVSPPTVGGRGRLTGQDDDDTVSDVTGDGFEDEFFGSTVSGANVNFLSKWVKFIQKLVRKSSKGTVSTSAPALLAPVHGLAPTTYHPTADLVIEDDDDDNEEDPTPDTVSDDSFEDDDFGTHITYTGTQTPPITIPVYARPPGTVIKLGPHSI
jgi:hypothetical protein